MSKTIIAGGRDFLDYNLLERTVDCLTVTEVVSGKAKGADSYGEKYAKLHNIKIKEFPADWERYGKRAGIVRNEEMAHYADRLVAYWDGKSRGTKHMIEYMKKLKKPVKVVLYNQEDEDEW